jgi:hypothetical protein
MTKESLISEIIKSVAAADNIEPSELPNLHEYIDTEILHKLDEQERGKWSFTFQYSDHQITVTHESQVFVDGTVPRSNTSTSQSNRSERDDSSLE